MSGGSLASDQGTSPNPRFLTQASEQVRPRRSERRAGKVPLPGSQSDVTTSQESEYFGGDNTRRAQFRLAAGKAPLSCPQIEESGDGDSESEDDFEGQPTRIATGDTAKIKAVHGF
eukprot:74941-Rhodomonas_salina.1